MSHLEDSLEGVKRDKRGLMPLAKARAFLAAIGPKNPVKPFRDPRADEHWAALLSLEDAAEFVREARRVPLENHPRGHYNTALFERYGAAIEPWIADHFDPATGKLENVPWNVVPLLLELESESAFAIVAAIRELASDDYATPEKYYAAWVARHLPVAAKVLAARTLAGDTEASTRLKALTKGRSRAVLAAIAAAHGPDAAKKLQAELAIVAKLEPDEILTALDTAAANQDMFSWPRFSYDFECGVEFSGLRLVAARSTEGDAWGIALERITGCNHQELEVYRFRYGSEVEPGMVVGADGCSQFLPVSFELDETSETAVGASIVHEANPKQRVKLDAKRIKELDLKPGRGSEPDSGVGGPAVVLMRAFQALYPGAIWPPVEDTLRALKLDPKRAVVVACTDAFAHVDGDKPPSKSKAYKSAAAAIVNGKPEVFDAGTPNTHWRKHAKHKG